MRFHQTGMLLITASSWSRTTFTRCVLVLTVALLLGRTSQAAPMFPDVPDMWAKDAVAALAAKGLLEGYPDGTFKGDRAATRYEVAMIVARLLARMEQEHASFATRADLDEVRRLASLLRDELDALGVRVQSLEDNVTRLDKRVTELERITFFGSTDARFGSLHLGNSGLGQGTNLSNTGGIGGTTAVALISAIVPGAIPVAGLFNNSVGIPIVVGPNGALASTLNVVGRPLLVRELPWNASNFNVSNVGVGGVSLANGIQQGVGMRPNYSAVVGSSRTLGGDNAAGNASALGPSGGNGFVTGRVGQMFAVPGVLPTLGIGGHPQTSGQSWSGVARLGVNIKLNPDMEASAVFAAWFSGGDPIVDAFYGANAPRLSNPFGARSGMGWPGQGLDNQPFSRMTLDRFWFLHKPSQVKVEFGAFSTVNIDPLVYTPEVNPNAVAGVPYLDNYGLRISGRGRLLAPFEWEAFGSIVADGNRIAPEAVANGGANYQPYLWGGDVKWSFGKEGNGGFFKLNAMRIWDDPGSTGPATVGSISNMNGVWLNWANPNGFYAAQLSNDPSTASRIAGIGSTSDVRPIIPSSSTRVGNIPHVLFQDMAVAALGNLVAPINVAQLMSGNGQSSTFGPQSMFTWGASAGWSYAFSKKCIALFGASYANSDYKPSAASSYHAPDGNAFAVKAGLRLYDTVNVGAQYVQVNPYYNPYVLQYPSVGGVTSALWGTWYPEMYPISDKTEFPNNRQGYRVTLAYAPVNPATGKPVEIVSLLYGNMQQSHTGQQDIRYSPGSVSVGNLGDASTAAPNGFVLGQMPGFVDPTFPDFYPQTYKEFTGIPVVAAANQFTTLLENPRGRVTNWGVKLGYRFEKLHGLGVHFEHMDVHNRRGSALPAALGGSENNVDVHISGGVLAFAVPVDSRFTVKAGYAYYSFAGHMDPIGIFRNYAIDTSSTTFKNYDTDQTMPFVGFDWTPARNVDVNVTAQFLDNHDNLGTFTSPSFYMQRNPFSWKSTAITSQVKMSF